MTSVQPDVSQLTLSCHVLSSTHLGWQSRMGAEPQPGASICALAKNINIPGLVPNLEEEVGIQRGHTTLSLSSKSLCSSQRDAHTNSYCAHKDFPGV